MKCEGKVSSLSKVKGSGINEYVYQLVSASGE